MRTAEETRTENFEHCKAIATEIENLVNYGAYKCPECGEIVYLDADTAENEKHVCLCCGSEIDPEEAEPFTLWDYFSDALAIAETTWAKLGENDRKRINLFELVYAEKDGYGGADLNTVTTIKTFAKKEAT